MIFRTMNMGYTIKLVLVGDYRVGKTSLRRSYLGEHFRNNYLPTVGADFSFTEEKIGEKLFRFLIWDLAGETRFSKVRPMYYKGAYGAIVVFDITNRQNFENIDNWIDDFLKFSRKENCPIVIAGNKIDLVQDGKAEQAVSDEEINEYLDEIRKKLGKSHKIFFIKTSAKTGENVREAFNCLANEVANLLLSRSK